MNYKRVTIGLVVLTLLWIGNIYYYQKQQLPQPLFLQHYYDIQVWGNNLQFDLYYLVNNQDASKTAVLRIPKDEKIMFRSTEVVASKFTYHTLKKITVELNKSQLGPLSSRDELLFSELLVHFPGEGETKVNIGNIRIRINLQEHSLLKSRSAGGSSDNSGFTEFQTEQSMKIVGFENPLDAQMSDRLKVRINGTALNDIVFPLSFEPNQTVRIDYAFSSVDEKHPQADSLYNVEARLKYETVNGQEGHGNVFLRNIPFFENRDILRIVQERRE